MIKLLHWVLIGVIIYILFCNTTKSTFLNFKQPPSILNDYFDQIVCITIPKRRKHMEKMMRRYNIKADIFPAYLKDNMDKQKLIDEGFITPDCTLNNGRICCHYSHLQVLKNFLDDPHSKNILVFEDDMDQKYSGSEQLNNIIKPYLENVPYGWNYLNLSGSYEDCDKTRPTDSPYWRNAYSILHRNAIAFDKNGARTVYNMCRPMKDNPGDVLISELIKNNYLGNSYYTTKQLFRQDRENWGTNLGNSEPKQPICDPRKKHK